MRRWLEVNGNFEPNRFSIRKLRRGGCILRIGNVRDGTGKLISQPSSTKVWRETGETLKRQARERWFFERSFFLNVIATRFKWHGLRIYRLYRVEFNKKPIQPHPISLQGLLAVWFPTSSAKSEENVLAHDGSCQYRPAERLPVWHTDGTFKETPEAGRDRISRKVVFERPHAKSK